MSYFDGLVLAELFLLIAAGIGGAFELFNRRFVAALSMTFVLIGFTYVVFNRYVPGEVFVAGDDPREHVYHAARIENGEIVSDCIYAPAPHVKKVPFFSREEAESTGRVADRCVTGSRERDGHRLAARGK